MGGAHHSHFLRQMPSQVYEILTHRPVTTNLHHDGVLPSSFRANSKLNAFFNMLSTNVDRKELEFVSTMEARRYPILATQWHPERNQFEWSVVNNISHTAAAVAANSWMALRFVDEARRNVRARGMCSFCGVL